ncbi:chemotaxis-specific protein-glutamate methyltransferase CheB [Lutispora thermophila]|uniref:Protein-glutamate methylesterase/protein-glutamine glutaminase n=1 Tax=Lutispora thermophila DSM 19022 TaxID=1122184 RepID=A0A1M6DR45_9FIRM|nr:chemotaxis-specific protein-glutamate methyltransferase CheB [Lutispora thermophila]SHI75681.1 two-component system, chemotaxis family, response regulator CheB [Lutispora thermophila DSM 19022]
MKKLNVMIVDDSALFRKFLSDAVEKTGIAEVQSAVANGNECLSILKQNTPDVVLLDINMPGMNGLDVLRSIKENYENTKVIMISSADNSDNVLTVTALEIGAIDFISKPKGNDWQRNMLSISSYLKVLFNYIIINKYYRRSSKETAATAAKSKVERESPTTPKQSNIEKETESAPTTPNIERQAARFKTDLVLIASSTGGPKALYDVCSKLPADLGVPVLIVQHMPADFTKIFANSLNNISKLEVSEAKDGDIPKAGHIYIAKGGKHMIVTKSSSNTMTIKLEDGPTVNGVRPAADILFASVADEFPNLSMLAVVLTGMGKDGTEGIRKLKEKTKCYVITQSEKTCAVYGMPKSVYEANLSDEVLDIQDIAGGIVRRVKNK